MFARPLRRRAQFERAHTLATALPLSDDSACGVTCRASLAHCTRNWVGVAGDGLLTCSTHSKLASVNGELTVYPANFCTDHLPTAEECSRGVREVDVGDSVVKCGANVGRLLRRHFGRLAQRQAHFRIRLRHKLAVGL